MKKFIVLMMAVILIGVAIPGAQASYWNEGNYGYSDETAYVIDSVSDFVEFQTRVNNGTEPEGLYYKLGINLNLAGNYPKWIPIGISSPFKGHFNGNGKTITMNTEKYPEVLTTRDIEYNSSLFGSIETDNDYAVKDLTVEGTIRGSFLAAGIVLRLYKGSIENCTFTGTLSSRGYSDVSRESFYHIVASAGGIAGYVLGGTIKNCTVKSSEITIQPYFSGQWSIYPGGGNVGGIAAELNGGAVEGCLVTDSTIQAAPHAPKDQDVSSIYLGGIVGLLNKGTLRNNSSYAQVVSSHANPSITNKDSKYCAGGIIGKIDSFNSGIEWNVYAGAAHGIGYDAGGGASDEPGCVNAGKIQLTITTASLPSGNIGDSYSETLTAATTGGTWPVTWALTSGTLPDGFTLNADGTISGSPTAKGTYKFTVKASIDSSGIISASKEYTITIADNQPSYSLTVKNESLSNGTVGKSYEETLRAELTGTELPATWTCTGTLPPGLTLNTSGTITGTPTAAGTYTFTVTAVFGAFTGTKSFTVVIAQAYIPVNPPSITTTSLPDGTKGKSYSATLTSTGDVPITWTLSGLPAGLTASAQGVISGKPTASGTFFVTVTAANSGGTDTKTLTLTVSTPAPAVTPPAITTGENLGAFNVGDNISLQLAATGDTPITWTADNLPSGLALDASGNISGAITTAGIYTFTVTATNTGGNNSRTFTITVNSIPIPVTAPTITTGENLGTFKTGAEISIQLSATGDTPITWSASGLPEGLAVDSEGKISGTITVAGTYTFTVTATNTGGNDSRTFTITVNAIPIPVTAPTITTDENLGTFKTGAKISIQLSATGDTPITWSASGLPEGLAVDSEGKISGTITVAGTYTFTVTATNTGGNDSRTFTLTVEAHSAAPSITTTSINGGKTGTSYTATFTATGSDPITWTAGGLPEGFSMSESGTLSGTTETAGTYTITVTASNSAGSDTKEYTLTIEETVKITPPKITTESLPSATEGQTYREQITADGIGITWSNSGGLPAGLSFSKDGILSGTPEKSGTFRVTLVAKNSAGVDSKIFTLTIESGTISGAAPVIKTSKLPDGFIGWDYNYQIEAEGTVTAWEISDPQNFPDGLELNETTGEITGNIRTSKVKTFKFKVIAYNGSTGSKAKTLSLKVIAKEPSFKTEDIKAAKWGTNYSFTMKLSNFKATAWSIVGDIPEGLTFDKGKFTGKPLEVGEFEVSITASNGAVDIEDDFILKVNGIAPKLKGSLKSGKENTYYECTLKATGTTPIEWEFGNENGEGTLPEGLSWIQSETGDSCKIYGTPEQAFSQRVIITLTNGDNEADSITKSLKMTIKAVKPKFKTKAKDVPGGKTGEDYECQIELDTKATPFAVEWEYSGEMPEGLYFDEGLIYGVPSETGNFPITITVRNANNTTYKAILRMTLRITENKTALPSEETTASEDSRPEFVNGIAYYERGEIRAEILARAVNAVEIIAAVLPAVEVEECGMYEFAVSLDKAAPEGGVMVWHSYPNGEDDPNDKDNAIFLDAEGETIETVPADYTVTVGAWLEPGVIYEPVITVKR